jgi:oxygen-independent coproporphyrinogen-3 oxidase
MNAPPLAPPLAIYAHFPWCVQKCPYCDFNSHQAPSQIPEQRYLDALLEDLALDIIGLEARPLVSIFMGGGTPSLFSPDAIARLLHTIKQTLPISSQLEVTLEANPGTIEHGQFAEYRAAGVNRVSLGAQSFDPAQLKKLGRIHGKEDIARAVDELRRAGIDNFNLDLMYGLPGQTRVAALSDLQQAIDLAPAHLSHYQLTLEPGTPFYHRPPELPDSDECYAMQLECQALLAAAGYRQYEVSAYAQAGRQSVHNRNYWQFGDYLGLGAGAHGKVTLADQVLRTERRKQPRDYLGHAAAQRVVLRQAVAPGELPFEFMLNALRLREGFDPVLFESRTGLHWSTLDAPIARAEQRGLLEREGHIWRPTDLGRRFLNDLVSLFLADCALRAAALKWCRAETPVQCAKCLPGLNYVLQITFYLTYSARFCRRKSVLCTPAKRSIRDQALVPIVQARSQALNVSYCFNLIIKVVKD